MKIIVYRKALEGVINNVRKTLDEFGIEYKVVQEIESQDLDAYELLVVVGGDRDVLQAFHKIGKAKVPVLGV
ncbi:MAG: hypothetical protein QXD82_04830, partial [Nitrososphaerales archaeon]